MGRNDTCERTSLTWYFRIDSCTCLWFGWYAWQEKGERRRVDESHLLVQNLIRTCVGKWFIPRMAMTEKRDKSTYEPHQMFAESAQLCQIFLAQTILLSRPSMRICTTPHIKLRMPTTQTWLLSALRPCSTNLTAPTCGGCGHVWSQKRSYLL